MRKFPILLIALLTFLLAAAFRFAVKRTPERRRLSAVICRIAPDGDIPDDIPPLTGWGNYKWKITTQSDSAQFYFNQGINMYYAFHTLEARASFVKAIKFDPTCAMAWYGKALALGPTINFGNGFRAEAAAYEAAQKGKRYATTCTPMEKGLIDAMAIRYSADTTSDLKALQTAYSSSMQDLANRFAKNADVVALYADALMLEHPWDLYDPALAPKPWTPEIRKVLEKTLALDPLHPGGLHFMIHTVEGSLHPEDGLASAEKLATLMPDVAHVVHMPSHIYIRAGYYKKGIDVNDHAVAGYSKYVGLYQPVTEQSGLYLIHAVHLKIACAVMAGDYKTSLATSDTIRTLFPAEMMATKDGFANFVQYVYQFRLFTFLRFGQWEKILAEPAADTSLTYASAISHFARGVARSRLGQLPEAEEELKALRDNLHSPVLKQPFDPFSNAYEAALVAEGILDGVIAEQKHDLVKAKLAFEQATAAEDALVYNEPRDWPLPARHYLGNLLLKTGDYKAAIKVFERDLQINPNNGWSLTGLKSVYIAVGDKAALKRIDAALMPAWQIRDVTVTRAVF